MVQVCSICNFGFGQNSSDILVYPAYGIDSSNFMEVNQSTLVWNDIEITFFFSHVFSQGS